MASPITRTYIDEDSRRLLVARLSKVSTATEAEIVLWRLRQLGAEA